jgi:alkanesulfonate monooxygenase SsuD/methylene tetrahydromethanopterin reductase-like flavin-dependent oxidoreductase (luciferase family)
MEFGLALDLGQPRTSLDRLLDEYTPLLKLAEAYGFTSVWAGESYPTGKSGGFHLPAPLLALAALAPRTPLKLGTGVTLLPAWSPLRLAYDTAVLDQLSGGRLVLGVGGGTAPFWARFGVDAATVGDRMDEMLAALRALWAGEPGYRGQVVTIEQGIGPLPLQPGGPPIWVGGLAPRAARRAARYGDAWTASTSYRLTDVRTQVARYHKALAAEGKEPGAALAGANRLTFLAATPEQARAQGQPYVERVLKMYAGHGGLRDAAGTVLAPDAPLLEAAGAEVCLVGSPETVGARIEEYARAGLTHLQMRVAPGGMPPELVAQTITLAGEQVLPRFRSG